MSGYRLYHMSNRTGHIERCEIIDARDDGHAEALAERAAGPNVMELWQEARRIRRFEPVVRPSPEAGSPSSAQ